MPTGKRLRRRAGQLSIAVLVACLAVPAAVAAESGDVAAAVPGELVVRYEPRANAAERAGARRQSGVRAVRGLDLARTQLVEVRAGSTGAALRELRSDPDVSQVSRNWLRRPVATPNDPYFGALWGLRNTGQEVADVAGTADADIDAPEAWDIQPGWGPEAENGVVVAVMDTGADLGHPELKDQLWTNGDEIPANGLDDDLNGYVDDVHGYDFAGEDLEDPVDGDPDPDDSDGHGTHVAGTVLGEADNGEGVAGVAPGSQLMTLKVCAPDEEGEAACPLAAMIEAYAYAAANGAKVLNGSLGGSGFSSVELALLDGSPQTLFVFAAGNGGEDGIGDDNDSERSYPCALDEEAGYTTENLICVAATDQHDGLAGFSNYGSESVDLGAPGTRILSAYPLALTDGSKYLPYLYMAGTSMATPHVTGVAALLFSALPQTDSARAKQAVLDSAEPRPELAGRTVSGGRLNARLALEELGLNPAGSGGEGEGPPESEKPSGEESGDTPSPEPADAPDAPDAGGSPREQPAAVPPSVDHVRPRTFFRKRPRRVVRTRFRRARVVFRFGSDEAGAIFLCKLDRRPVRVCRTRTVRRLGRGGHVIRVKAIDAAGNRDRTAAVYRFRVNRVGRGAR